eukprot:GHVO01009414.1.p1 GENE.GHVO01009414.1~~GHVO01009414.1.p1  ORF type:complete len:410 (+),score=87.29 GHVO01009414.1:1627-2856(+)
MLYRLLVLFLTLVYGGLVNLDRVNFEYVIDTGKSSLVLFQHPKCSFCKEFKATFESAAEVSKDVQFYDVNCGDEGLLCVQNEIESYPTVKFYKNGVSVKGWVGASRSVGEIATFVDRMHTGSYKRLTDPTDIEGVGKRRSRAFVLFTDEEKLPSGFESVSWEYFDRHSFFVADTVHASLLVDAPGPPPTLVAVGGMDPPAQTSDIGDDDSFWSFVESYRFPKVMRFKEPRSFFPVKESNRYLVVLVTDDDDTDDVDDVERHAVAMNRFKDYAMGSQQKVYFGIMDRNGAFSKALKAYSVPPSPCVIVFAPGTSRDVFVDPRINITDIDGGISAVLEGAIEPVDMTEAQFTFLTRMARRLGKHVLPVIENTLHIPISRIPPTLVIYTMAALAIGMFFHRQYLKRQRPAEE